MVNAKMSQITDALKINLKDSEKFIERERRIKIIKPITILNTNLIFSLSIIKI